MIKVLKFIPIQLTLFLILGILFEGYFNFQPINLVWIISVLQALLLVVYHISNKRFTCTHLFGVLTFTLSFFIGATSKTFNNQLNRDQHYTNNQAFVTGKPVSAVISIQKILKSNFFYNKYEATLMQLNGVRAIGKILVNIEKDSIHNFLNVDDELLVKTAFREIKKPLNPYIFNYREYLQQQQIYHQIYITRKQYLQGMQTNQTVGGIASKIRWKINKSLVKHGFKEDELAIINALLLGQRQSINTNLQQRYASAGAIHILAVSGLHIGIILMLLMFLFKPLHFFKNGKIVSGILIISFLWIYAIIAGLSASVVRAVSMCTAFAIGMFLNRSSNVYNTLVISMFFLLLFNPYYLFEVGFQLSYIAVFFIVWVQPKLYILWKPRFWIVNKLWQLFTVSLAAQIGVLPLSLFYFHQFPGLFFLSNLVIIPFLGLILGTGFLLIVLSVFELLPMFLEVSYRSTIQYLNQFIVWISNQESFIIQNITFSLAMMLSFYVFIILFFRWVERKIFLRFVLLLISVIAIQSVSMYEKIKRESKHELIVFNKSKNSIVGIRNGNDLYISSSIDSLDTNENSIKSYVIYSGIHNTLLKESFNNLFVFNDELILVVDSSGVYNVKSLKPTMVLLQHSPKLNLERLLNILQPKLIIADGSNYTSYVERWKKTCLKNKTPFHSTMQKGAFILKSKSITHEFIFKIR
jgi:competence protein ComEC